MHSSTYIIGHYNLSARITICLLTPLMLCGETWDLKSTPNDTYFWATLHDNFIYSQSHCPSFLLLRGNRLRNIYSYFVLLEIFDVRHIVFQIMADKYTFDTVKEFIYPNSAVATKNDVSPEIKRKITLANSCYYILNGISKDLSHTTKVIQDAHPTRASLWRRGPIIGRY